MPSTEAKNRKTERDRTVHDALARIRGLAGGSSPDRSGLSRILEVLLTVAARRPLWTAEDFPPPEGAARHARYLISEDPDQSFALYLNVMRQGNLIIPHNHTTWACIAAVEGSEHNHLYRRLDDGTRSGIGILEQTDTVEVGPGQGIALLPDDIHAVEIKTDPEIRHLHLYGRSLETLSERIRFDLANGRTEKMPIGVETRR
ncbi:hypothetical protein [Telmatospirillum siberiense]|uniref:Cysteine dioxygenase n=1 Tax=Telmatospirillum siberiense TaxID=382514 RepID=A0A2N3Q1K8_9PROT|nr:hypothetical protein [Telmatospirillum siberiense]PKU26536.1 hypothetical protein CWS72_01450 [Telmatospirillum siberiense]